MYKGGYVAIVDMLQYFNDFAVLIRDHSEILSKEGMDVTKGEKSAQYCKDLSELYASYQIDSDYHKKDLKKIRDQALLYLTKAISHVQQVAVFRFRNEPQIKRAFTCEYRRSHRGSV